MTEKTRIVYFVQADELCLIKIGVADRLEKRLRELSHMSPDSLTFLGAQICPEGGALEKRLHLQFVADRAHGEWFYPTKALTDYILCYADRGPGPTKRMNAVLAFPTMPRGRPNKEMMRQREVAGLGKWL